MKFKCPHCGVPFGGFAALPPSVECPSCGRTFKPEDERAVARRDKEGVAGAIKAHFKNVNGDLAGQICGFLAEDPPLPGKGGYLRREEPIKEFIDAALKQSSRRVLGRLFESGRQQVELLDAMMRAFAEAQD